MQAVGTSGPGSTLTIRCRRDGDPARAWHGPALNQIPLARELEGIEVDRCKLDLVGGHRLAKSHPLDFGQVGALAERYQQVIDLPGQAPVGVREDRSPTLAVPGAIGVHQALQQSQPLGESGPQIGWRDVFVVEQAALPQ